jgi:hypothetical protein
LVNQVRITLINQNKIKTQIVENCGLFKAFPRARARICMVNLIKCLFYNNLNLNFTFLTIRFGLSFLGSSIRSISFEKRID